MNLRSSPDGAEAFPRNSFLRFGKIAIILNIKDLVSGNPELGGSSR
jgi:hypothetical protein